jgi:hypothetical protein
MVSTLFNMLYQLVRLYSKECGGMLTFELNWKGLGWKWSYSAAMNWTGIYLSSELRVVTKQLLSSEIKFDGQDTNQRHPEYAEILYHCVLGLIKMAQSCYFFSINKKLNASDKKGKMTEGFNSGRAHFSRLTSKHKSLTAFCALCTSKTSVHDLIPHKIYMPASVVHYLMPYSRTLKKKDFRSAAMLLFYILQKYYINNSSIF